MYDDEFELSTLPLAEAVAEAPPADLRAAVLAAAWGRREPGRPTTRPGRISSADAFERSVDDFYGLLASLGPEDGERHAHEDHGSVHDLVAHLTAVERLNQRWLDTEDEVELLPDHVAATRPTVEALAAVPFGEVVDQWHLAARGVVSAARDCPPSYPIVIHDIPGNVDVLLTLRIFELWAHAMDIAFATDRPLPVPDDERMLMMSSRLMRGVPGALLYRGAVVTGRTARFVLTGDAGGCYDVALDGGAVNGAEPDVTIIGDVVDVCRIAAGRLHPDGLDAVIEGDHELARLVLAHIDAFARD
ncbi:hypothetical protein F0U44_20340 [Nocardioides humilatus]|uniref:Mycothiol-dependent maleylpyruvate isomerase metal-binding domain-containing protein n=1 Tax=Nocardioides humilatus TaxID=2607660 RepID=A0A5B1L730_9ACTN|nr:maleylpyruvate isomerase N-terminal domain-containing protein [Nocardioides humilatus]KAA1415978.1 hypothetical protein F0U44_20340 [Nocardioides humilatus]